MKQESLEYYLGILESFDRTRLSDLCACVSEDIHFVDPFNNVRGRSAYRAIFSDMLDHLENHCFRVTALAWVENESNAPDRVAFIKWELQAKLPRLSNINWDVSGCSELHVSSAGLITAHFDYWDASQGLYEKFPIVGWLFRFLRQRLETRQK